ncbi:uncharacterized protein TNCV_362621 [Trichonephila clavipes]|nr:uncharacterized protein TNCV_362621 [Trichonephila clavipes]
MDVCAFAAWGTLNNHRAASCPLMYLVEGEERWKAHGHPQGFLSLNFGVEPSKIVLSPAWCSKLRLTTGVKILSLTRDEFHGPRSDFVRRVAVVTTTYGLGSNPGEDMGVYKCIVPLRHGGSLNSRRAASPLVWLVEGEERWEAPDYFQVSSLKIGVETSQIVLSPVWCSKLRLTTCVS